MTVRSIYLPKPTETPAPIGRQPSEKLAATVQPYRPTVSFHRAPLAAKRLMDIIGAVVGLVGLAPLFLLIGLAILLADKGAILFRQERVGVGGQRFKIYKFRTIYLRHCDPSGLTPAEDQAEHVLPFGTFLRSTGLDELPQLFNILIGEMSLVGPRPHIPGMLVDGRAYQDLVANYAGRTRMRPGLTGWAQCRGLRGPVNCNELAVARIDHDLYYIENFSVAWDLEILARTLVHLLRADTTGWVDRPHRDLDH